MLDLSASAAAVLTLAVVVASAVPARAEPRNHDGLYLRIGVGGGGAFGAMTGELASDSSGAAIASELSIGTTIRPGLVVGGGTFPMVALAPSYDGVSAGGQHVSGTGPFVDYYPDPRAGLHLRAGVLFAAGYLDGSAERDGAVGFGVGATIGAGYDRFVADQWSVGAIARVTGYRLTGVDDTIRLVAPALLVTATYH